MVMVRSPTIRAQIKGHHYVFTGPLRDSWRSLGDEPHCCQRGSGPPGRSSVPPEGSGPSAVHGGLTRSAAGPDRPLLASISLCRPEKWK